MAGRWLGAQTGVKVQPEKMMTIIIDTETITMNTIGIGTMSEVKIEITLGPEVISNGETIMKVATAFTNGNGDNKVL